MIKKNDLRIIKRNILLHSQNEIYCNITLFHSARISNSLEELTPLMP